MRRFGWIAAAAALVALLVAVEMMIIARASGYEEREEVVFAKVDIKKNTVITEDMLEKRKIAKSAVHPETVRIPGEAVSMRAAADVEQGEMLLKTRLLPGDCGIITAEDKTKRLFSAELEADQANAWQLAEGRRVDVIYIPNHGNENEKPPEAAGVVGVPPAESGVRLLRNVRIAGIVGDNGKTADGTEGSSEPRYALFEITGEQAVFLAYAKNKGRIELSGIPE